MEEQNNNNQEQVNNNSQQSEQVEYKGIKLPVFLYHFPDGSKGLMIHLSKDIETAEIIPVHYPHAPQG